MVQETNSSIEITPRAVREMAGRGDEFLFVDVREAWEYGISRIEGAVLIPLREIPANFSRLKEAGKIVLFCHHGMRSLDAASWLRAQGIAAALSMSGGIDRWAAEVDPNVPRY